MAHVSNIIAVGLPPTVAAVHPLMVGESVACGWPSPSQDYFDGRINLNEHLIKDVTSTFVVRVTGDSMEGAGISDGDELIVNRALTPRDGSIVIAILDGELTVKRLQLKAGGVVLHAENPRYPDIQVPEPSRLEIWATAETCLHDLRP